MMHTVSCGIVETLEYAKTNDGHDDADSTKEHPECTVKWSGVLLHAKNYSRGVEQKELCPEHQMDDTM